MNVYCCNQVIAIIAVHTMGADAGVCYSTIQISRLHSSLFDLICLFARLFLIRVGSSHIANCVAEIAGCIAIVYAKLKWAQIKPVLRFNNFRWSVLISLIKLPFYSHWL